ncbi:unnamed protein product [Parnassius apollo]|uniref:(apollo) hypothetical protein n=1 Tax=Parnassius apollo TaxID=110799 RepID=A0A8S3WBB0_PARAO|nr:unnamed protein product [Parnassius apollo]
MDLTLLSSDSDSDLEMLAQLSDSSDEDETLRRTPKRIRRVNYTQSLDDVSEAEHRYNEAHIKTRNTIERAFGVWKRRFPIVALTLCLSIPNMKAVIIATTVLHNICRNHNLTEIPSEVELPSIDNSTMPHNVVVNDIPTNHRTDLINNYFMTL